MTSIGESYLEEKGLITKHFDKLEKRTWSKKRLKAHFFLLYLQWMSSMAGVAKFNKEGYEFGLSLFEDNLMTASYNEEDLIRMRNFLEKNYAFPDWTKNYFDEFMKRSKNLRTYLDEVLAYDEDALLRRDTLLSIIDKLFFVQGMGYITESFNIVGEDSWVIDKIKALAPNVSDEEIDILLEPIYDSFLQSYLKAIKKLSNDDVKRDWFWIKTSYIVCEELTDARIEEDRKRAIHELTDDKTLILKKYGEKIALFIEFIDYFVKLQDERKENVLRANYTLHKFLALLAKKSGIENDLLLACTTEELLRIIDGEEFDTTIPLKRKKKSVLLCTRTAYESSMEKDILEKIFPLLSPTASEVKGFCASKGLVRGIAKVVLSEFEFGKVKKGDVLITAMTRPEFLPVMEKACAFVTDEGGITCHAAIIAREMKKPCIIGTRDATQLLKDGDLVEVDANIGVVRKI